MWKQVVVRGLQMFRVNFGVCQNGHEIGVADPPGNDVHMNVLVESGSARLAQINADIESFGRFDGSQDFHAFLGQVVEFGVFFFI